MSNSNTVNEAENRYREIAGRLYSLVALPLVNIKLTAARKPGFLGTFTQGLTEAPQAFFSPLTGAPAFPENAISYLQSKDNTITQTTPVTGQDIMSAIQDANNTPGFWDWLAQQTPKRASGKSATR